LQQNLLPLRRWVGSVVDFVRILRRWVGSVVDFVRILRGMEREMTPGGHVLKLPFSCEPAF
jgi:hypothetical protein